jgi:hypothetical protein
VQFKRSTIAATGATDTAASLNFVSRALNTILLI